MTAVFDDWVAICSLEIGAQTAGHHSNFVEGRIAAA